MTVQFGDDRLPSLFWSKVRRSTNGCWHWTGTIDARNGYGTYQTPRRNGERTAWPAHRWAFHKLVRELEPRGAPGHLQVDHECHNRSKSCEGGPSCRHRRCVNPAHLAPKRAVENVHASPHTQASKNRAKTHCKRGHPLSGSNLRVDARGRRSCYTCHLAGTNAARRRRHAAKREPGWRKVERNSRKTHCKYGHPFSGDNLVQRANGARGCRTCMTTYHAQWYRARNPERPPRTHCKYGHALTPDNVYIDAKRPNTRACSTCRKAAARRSRERRADRAA